MDTLAIGLNDDKSLVLWQAHQKRMATQSENLRLELPKAGLSWRDPLGLRAAVSLILLIGIIAAGTDGFSRIGQALSPHIKAATLAPDAELTIWITAPAYTQKPPVVLRKGGSKYVNPRGNTAEPAKPRLDADPIQVPVGSELLAQMKGGSYIPILQLGSRNIPFKPIETGSYHVETKLLSAKRGMTRLSVLQKGLDMASWGLTILEDQRPTVAFSSAPETSSQLRLRLPYEASDDHRLKNLTASIRRLDGVGMPDGNREIILRLPLPGGKEDG